MTARKPFIGGCLAAGLCIAAANAGTVAQWNMKPTGINSPCVLDTQLDEGIQNLWAVNGNNNAFATNAEIPPARMRTRADDSACSYDASAIAAFDGALLYSASGYGDVLRFTNAFSIELFFKTLGDKSASGVMQLLLQGHTTLRFGLTINEPSPGNVRFTLRDSAGQQHLCDLAARNYADGQWHYLCATFDPAGGSPGTLTLSILNEDSSCDSAGTTLPPMFPGLRTGSDGNTHLGRNTYLKSQNPRTFLGLLDEVQISEGIVAGTNRLGALPGPITRWRMDPAGTNFPAVLDALPGDGTQHLITYNGLTNNQYPASAEVPPAVLFASGCSGGAFSFNSASFTNMGAALFYPQDVYGNAFSFTGGFTVELFFKSQGNRSGAGYMELVMQGENTFRYGIIVNEPGPGNVRFAIHDGQGHIPLTDLAARNYADGQWHYLRAKYAPEAGANGLLALSIANTDGSIDSAANYINSSFVGLPVGNDGNLFIGRNVFAWGSNSRTFIGLVDEV